MDENDSNDDGGDGNDDGDGGNGGMDNELGAGIGSPHHRLMKRAPPRGYFRQRKKLLPHLQHRPGVGPQDLHPEVDEKEEKENLERIKNSFNHTPGLAAPLPRDDPDSYYQYFSKFSPESSFALAPGKEEEMTKVLSDLSRYNYVLGSTPSHFRVFSSLKCSQYDLRVLDNEHEKTRPFTYLSLNDALQEPDDWPEFSQLFLSFIGRRFSMPTPWEKKIADAGQEVEEPGPPDV